LAELSALLGPAEHRLVEGRGAVEVVGHKVACRPGAGDAVDLDATQFFRLPDRKWRIRRVRKDRERSHELHDGGRGDDFSAGSHDERNGGVRDDLKTLRPW
jgi:hypothetical protein